MRFASSPGQALQRPLLLLEHEAGDAETVPDRCREQGRADALYGLLGPGQAQEPRVLVIREQTDARERYWILV